MKLSNFLGGIKILRKYNGGEYSISSDNIGIYFWVQDTKMFDEDREELINLGWEESENKKYWFSHT